MKKLIPVLLGCFAFSSLPLHAADKGTVADHNISEYRVGTMITNDPVSDADLKGKVVLLEMWGINCGPCVASMPELQKFYNQQKDKGLVVVGLHCDVTGTTATEEEVKAKVKQLKVKFPITKGGGGPTAESGIPRSLLFDATGKLIYEGRPGADMEKAAKKALKEAAAAGGGDAKTTASAAGSKESTTKPAAAPKGGALISERAWKSADGRTMMAALISVDGDNAKFKKKDGTTFTYPLSKLVEDDQTTIKEAVESAKSATSTP